MLRGYRSIVVATGLIILGILTVITYAKTVPFGQSLQQEAANHAEIHRQNAEYRIQRFCSTPVADPLCVEQTRQTQRENERQEYDLAAQRMSAWWAQVMGVAALIGMGLSAVGVILVWITFRETKRTADEAREANRIQEIAIKNAEKEAERARDALVEADRAFIYVKAAHQKPPPLDEPSRTVLEFAIENVGKTPARNFEISFTISSERVYKKRRTIVRRFDRRILPETSGVLGPILIKIRGNYPKYIVGVISYTTIHAAAFQTYFCFEIQGLPQINQLGHMINTPINPVACIGLPQNT